MSADSEKQVLDYLDRVADEAQRRIRQPAERSQFVQELRARIRKAAERKGNRPKAVQKILADLGPAERQVDEFLMRRSGSTAGPGVPSPRPRTDEVVRPQPPPRAEVRAREVGTPRIEAPARPAADTRPESAAPSATPPAAARAEPSAAPPTGSRQEAPRSSIPRGEPARTSPEAETTPIEVKAPVAARPAGIPGSGWGPLGDLPPLARVTIVLVCVAILTGLLGWFGWLIGAAAALIWRRTARGVRVVALVTIPLVGLPLFLLLGLGTDVDQVMTRIYPLVVGVLGAAFLVWGHFRYQSPEKREPPQPPPRRPQLRLRRGFSRHSRG